MHTWSQLSNEEHRSSYGLKVVYAAVVAEETISQKMRQKSDRRIR